MRALRRPTGWIVAVFSAVTVSVSAFAATPLTETFGDGRAEVNWTTGTLTVTGSGAPPDRGSLGQRRLLAERAAVVDGYRQLAELIHGVRVDAETVVKDFTIESDTIRTQVSTLVWGAQRVDTRYLSDGSVEVDLQVRLHGPSSLFSAIDFNRKIAKPAAPQAPVTATPEAEPEAPAAASPASAATPAPAVPEPAPGVPAPTAAPAAPPARAASATAPAKPTAPAKAYTGLIVDCRELNIQPAMSPAILDESGNELYVGQLPIDPDQVINYGIVGYVTGLEEARTSTERVGTNPLIVKGKKVSGSYKADVVLSNGDARTVSDAARAADFLTQSKVVFILKP